MLENNPHRSRLKGIVEMNMTPLMDLTFMLLIIFVITVPVLDYTTDITPPRMTTTHEVSSTKDIVMVTLDKDGICKLDGLPTGFSELTQAFLSIRQQQGKTGIYLRGDGARPYEDIVAIIRAAKNAGMQISLMTQAE